MAQQLCLESLLVMSRAHCSGGEQGGGVRGKSHPQLGAEGPKVSACAEPLAKTWKIPGGSPEIPSIGGAGRAVPYFLISCAPLALTETLGSGWFLLPSSRLFAVLAAHHVVISGRKAFKFWFLGWSQPCFISTLAPRRSQQGSHSSRDEL